MSTVSTALAPVKLPRVAITFCTQCRWMLRAAYYAQELMSTFGNGIGEVALVPATGGVFQVRLTHRPPPPPPAQAAADGTSTEYDDAAAAVETLPEEVLLWDRKSEGGFPETKILKQKVRNLIEPGRDLGHSDRPSGKKAVESSANAGGGAGGGAESRAQQSAGVEAPGGEATGDGQPCEDCR